MKIGQIRLEDGQVHAAVVVGEEIVDVADPAAGLSGVAEFLDRAVETGRRLEQVLEQRLASGGGRRYPLAEA